MPKKHRILAGFLFLVASMTAASAQASYRVQGTQILHQDNPVQLRGVNWFGFETELLVAHGLWKRNWQEMIAQMEGLKINAVRIPVCPDSLHDGRPGGIDYDKNPDLRGLDSLAILDKVVAEFDSRGIHVLIDHHRPDCHAISELWYTDDYSEAQWIADLVKVAGRYRKHEHFMGIDLKNEPHGRATWGAGNPTTDWNTAAEKAAKAVLDAAPNILVFVEGVEDSNRCTDAPNAWWGGNLAPMNCAPLDIPADRLVLSPHVYGPDVHPQPYFESPDFPDNLIPIWEAHFGQFADDGFAIVPGEFGGRYGHAGDARDRDWQIALIEYLRKKNLTSGFYWSWNPNSGDTGGLLQNDWQTVWPTKIALLNRYWFGTTLAKIPEVGGAVVQSPERPLPPGTPPVAPPQNVAENLNYTVTTMSDWGAGYCVDVAVRNSGSAPVEWKFQMPAEGKIDNLWNAQYERIKQDIRVQGVDWNRQLKVGGETHFGYCAKRQAPEISDELAGTAELPDVETQVAIQSRWQTGYCAEVTVRNNGSQAVDWRVNLKVQGRVNNLWRGDFLQSGNTITVQGKDYNRRIEPGKSENFGFCSEF